MPLDEGAGTRPSRVAPRRGLAITRRALAVLVVVFVLLFSYLNSLRVYFGQQQEMERTRQVIAAEKADISTLQDEKKRWQDPDYVKAQARIRLGWVVPGEIGYKVIGADGKPLGGGSELDTKRPVPGNKQVTWWQRLLGSVRTADDPVPTQANPKQRPTEVKYSPTATPKKTVAPSPTSTATP